MTKLPDIMVEIPLPDEPIPVAFIVIDDNGKRDLYRWANYSLIDGKAVQVMPPNCIGIVTFDSKRNGSSVIWLNDDDRQDYIEQMG